MLNENHIVDLLCRHLESQDFSIVQRCSTTQRGVDIIATRGRDSVTLLVEAKGETSSRLGSARHGKLYTSTQVFDRVSKGLYAAMVTASSAKAGEISCLAFPGTELFLRYLKPIQEMLQSLRIRVYLVTREKVTVYGA